MNLLFHCAVCGNSAEDGRLSCGTLMKYLLVSAEDIQTNPWWCSSEGVGICVAWEHLFPQFKEKSANRSFHSPPATTKQGAVLAEGRCPTESCWGRGWSHPCGGRCQQWAEVLAQHLRGGEEDRWHRSFTLKLLLFGEMSEKHNFPAGPSGRDFAGCRARHIRQHHPAGGALASVAAGAEVMVLAMTAPELMGFFSLSCLIGVSLNCVHRCLFKKKPVASVLESAWRILATISNVLLFLCNPDVEGSSALLSPLPGKLGVGLVRTWARKRSWQEIKLFGEIKSFHRNDRLFLHLHWMKKWKT